MSFARLCWLLGLSGLAIIGGLAAVLLFWVSLVAIAVGAWWAVPLIGLALLLLLVEECAMWQLQVWRRDGDPEVPETLLTHMARRDGEEPRVWLARVLQAATGVALVAGVAAGWWP